MKKDVLARAGRIASLGKRRFGVREDDFEAYLADIKAEAAAASTIRHARRCPGRR